MEALLDEMNQTYLPFEMQLLLIDFLENKWFIRIKECPVEFSLNLKFYSQACKIAQAGTTFIETNPKVAKMELAGH